MTIRLPESEYVEAPLGNVYAPAAVSGCGTGGLTPLLANPSNYLMREVSLTAEARGDTSIGSAAVKLLKCV